MVIPGELGVNGVGALWRYDAYAQLTADDTDDADPVFFGVYPRLMLANRVRRAPSKTDPGIRGDLADWNADQADRTEKAG
jgi:hypothetical protein